MPNSTGAARLCVICAGPLPPRKKKICGEECLRAHAAAYRRDWRSADPARVEADRARARAKSRTEVAERLAAKAPRYCVHCGAPIDPRRRVGTVQCGADTCRKAQRAAEMRDWQQRYREQNGKRYEHDRFPGNRLVHNRARRALKLATQADPIDSADVFERDGWRCGVCGGDVDPLLRHPDPLSASLDHVVPLSRGGTHTLDNVRCAHLRCNVRKNARLDEELTTTR